MNNNLWKKQANCLPNHQQSKHTHIKKRNMRPANAKNDNKQDVAFAGKGSGSSGDSGSSSSHAQDSHLDEPNLDNGLIWIFIRDVFVFLLVGKPKIDLYCNAWSMLWIIRMSICRKQLRKHR